VTDSLVIAALCAVGALSVMTFLFSLSFARRLRQMAVDPRLSPSASPTLLPTLGTEIQVFDAVTLDGTAISNDDFAGVSTVAIFVSTTCEACQRLSKQLLSRPLDEPTIVFVNGRDSSVPAFASAFNTAANHVVWSGDDESIRLAFGVEAFPTLLRVNKGFITEAAFAFKDFIPRPKRVLVESVRRP
jgi:hypothetical protein